MLDLKTMSRFQLLKELQTVRNTHNLNRLEDELLELIINMESDFSDKLIYAFLNLYSILTKPVVFPTLLNLNSINFSDSYSSDNDFCI